MCSATFGEMVREEIMMSIGRTNFSSVLSVRAMGKTGGTSDALEDFAPERFLDGKETVDPYNYVFGFGRR